MNRFWKAIMLSVALCSILSLGILGCGSPEPEIPAADIDNAAIDAQIAKESEAEAAKPVQAAPEGEETLPEEGP